MPFTYFFCILFCMAATATWADPPDSLRFVSMVIRHGDRSPYSVYPTAREKVADRWIDGSGWLTNLGIRQEYKLGEYIRQRYDGFLNTTRYNHSEIYIESSSKERCIMSAYAFLANLYPPQGDQIWNENLLWQPIPVQTIPKKEDNKLRQSASCPMIEKLYGKELASDKVKKLEEENKDFFRMIEEKTGIQKESMENIWEVTDVLVCEKSENITWDAWAQQAGVFEKLVRLGSISLELWFVSPTLARLTGGVLLKEIVENMQKAANTSAPTPKFYMYSAHDSTIASVLSAMHVWDTQWMDFSSVLMVELHQLEDDFEVRVLFRNETTLQDPYVLTPPGCGSPCMLKSFVKAVEGSLPVDWNKECQVHDGAYRAMIDQCGLLIRLLLVVGVYALMK